MSRIPKPEKRQRIIAAAKVHFTRYGLTKSTMQEIAEEAGVAVGTIYLYFKDKLELLIACADNVGEEHRRKAEEILSAHRSASHKLKKYVLSRYHKCREIGTGSRHAAELAREVIRVHPQRLREEYQIMSDTLARILADGVAQKEFYVPDVAGDVQVFLLSISHFFPNASMALKEWPQENLLHEVLEWFVSVWSRSAMPSKSVKKPRERKM